LQTSAHSSDFKQLLRAAAKAVHAISEAIALVLELRSQEVDEGAICVQLREHFVGAYPKSYTSTGQDPHIVDGLHQLSKRGHYARIEGEQPRIVQLVLMHLNEAERQAGRLAKGHVLLPSPLYIAVEALTLPEEPYTRAYSIVAAKHLLAQRLGVWPRNAFSADRSHDETFDETTVIEEFSNCRTWVEYDDLWRIKSDRRKSYIGHFLAMRGVLLLRFTTIEAIKFLREELFSSRWQASSSEEYLHAEFKLSARYLKLPAPADFMNEILGVPIAIRGFENVFFNGIKPSVGAGLVVQLSGGPGTGKTTFALALSSALAPIGTKTLYLSFEEAEGDLRSKLQQQRQTRLSKVSYYSTTDREWFTALPVSSGSELAVIEKSLLGPLGEAIARVRDEVDVELVRTRGGDIPQLPFLVILDSVSALASGSASVRERMASFVEQCRKLRVLVILITSDDKQSWGDLDYLVDMVIKLRVEGADDHNGKPVRLFSLVKSRQQISRHGTHIFHLSGDSGFRIAPQLASQMDGQQNIVRRLWDKTCFIDALNVRASPAGGHKYIEYLRVHWRSQILLQGRGSSGKAGLALKLALSPRYDDQGFVVSQGSARVLILSFLYPPEYYEVLQKRLHRGLVTEASVTRLRSFGPVQAEKYVKGIASVRVIHMTPGILHAEDLHSKLLRQLEEGRLSGKPYTAVIVDGLHNLALQFPGASESSNLFPIIYGTLSRANLTTITTFTTLSMESSSGDVAGDIHEESLFRLRVHLPLLHTLVQASDYVIEVFRKERPYETRTVPRFPQKGVDASYLLKVQSAISRDPPTSYVGWRRQELEFCDPGWEYEDNQPPLPIE
jgi:KaiC/GvpD/RAD55 family RecA-like ATPase